MNVCRIVLLSIMLTAAGCSLRPAAPTEGRVEILSTHPHDPEAYTQGLFIDEGRLYESTGLYGQSTLREVDLATGNVLRRLRLSDAVFGEGSVRLGTNLWMLTWREGEAYRIDPATFTVVATNRYDGEGWGLTTDGRSLIKSDGTSTLTWIDPATFTIERRLSVTENRRPLINLNELEYVDGLVFANVYQEDRIVAIDPRTGAVRRTYDLRGLRALLPTPHSAEVLNGIAWDVANRTLLVTGKNWPLLFVLRLVE